MSNGQQFRIPAPDGSLEPMEVGKNYAIHTGSKKVVVLVNRGYPAGRKLLAKGKIYLTPQIGKDFPVQEMHAHQLVSKSEGKLAFKSQERAYAPVGQAIVHEQDLDFLKRLAAQPELLEEVKSKLFSGADEVEVEVAPVGEAPKAPEVVDEGRADRLGIDPTELVMLALGQEETPAE